MIPKTIHYCWFGPNPLPKLVRKCMESWEKHLPDYKIMLWNETNSPMDVPFVKDAYAAKKYAFVSDYVRFWALQQHGGIYLDTDMFVVKSFDELLINETFFAWETKKKYIISCGVIGATINNPFIDEILHSYNALPFNLNNKDSIIVTRHISRCYASYSNKQSITIVDFDYFYPFPYEEKENVKHFLTYQTQNTVAIHLWNISWGSKRSLMRDKIAYYVKKMLFYSKNKSNS